MNGTIIRLLRKVKVWQSGWALELSKQNRIVAIYHCSACIGRSAGPSVSYFTLRHWDDVPVARCCKDAEKYPDMTDEIAKLRGDSDSPEQQNKRRLAFWKQIEREGKRVFEPPANEPGIAVYSTYDYSGRK